MADSGKTVRSDGLSGFTKRPSHILTLALVDIESASGGARQGLIAPALHFKTFPSYWIIIPALLGDTT